MRVHGHVRTRARQMHVSAPPAPIVASGNVGNHAGGWGGWQGRAHLQAFGGACDKVSGFGEGCLRRRVLEGIAAVDLVGA